MTAKPEIVRFADLLDVPPGDGVWTRVGGALVWEPRANFGVPNNASVTTAKLAPGRQVDAAHMTIDYSIPGLTGNFFVSPCAATGGAAITLGTIYFCPFWMQAGLRFTAILADVLTAGAVGDTAHLGLYNDDGNGRPGTRIFDAGAIDLSTTGNKQINQVYQPNTDGLLWGAFVTTVQTGGPQCERCNGPTGGPMSQISNAMNNSPSVGWSIAGFAAGLPADLTGQVFTIQNNPQRVALLFA